MAQTQLDLGVPRPDLSRELPGTATRNDPEVLGSSSFCLLFGFGRGLPDCGCREQIIYCDRAGRSLLPRCGHRRNRRQPQPRVVQPGATAARAPQRFPSSPRRGGRGRTSGAASQGLTGREPPPPWPPLTGAGRPTRLESCRQPSTMETGCTGRLARHGCFSPNCASQGAPGAHTGSGNEPAVGF
ncbi:hypothetical protein J1605_009816 [Eschrichtius robustus]|uniref:Uncharacterized protein n=1 Tax=Eschrichtius robustus TaxID=9764 RepID=A0AB34GVC5_ESCRO|nr:hypothetical protein J1605_009816 [Eschrichtius robustus]